MGHVTKGLVIGAGAIATNVATGFISRYLPAEWSQGPMKLAVKAGVGLVVLPLVVKFIPGGRRFVGPVAVGAAVAIVLDLFTAYLAPAIGLSDYEMTGIGEYEASPGGAALGDAYASLPGNELGYGENMYADTMY